MTWPLRRAALAVALVLTAAPLGAQLPEWARSGADAQYPSRDFVTAVGSAPLGQDRSAAQADADARALLALVQQLEVTIRATTTTQTSTSGAGADERIEAQFQQAVAAYSDLTVQGATIVHRAVDEQSRTAYAFAVLERASTVARLDAALKDADRSRTELVDQLQQATRLTPSGLGQLGDALLALDGQIARLAATRRSVDADGLAADVAVAVGTATLAKVLGSLRLDIVDGTEQAAIEGLAPKRPLVARLVTERDGRATPVVGARLEWIPGGLGMRVGPATVTDSVGLSAMMILGLERGVAFPLRITVRADWWRMLPRADSLQPAWAALRPSQPLVAMAALERRAVVGDSRTRVAVRGGPASEFADALIDALEAVGFRVEQSTSALGSDGGGRWWSRHAAQAALALDIALSESRLADSPLGTGVELRVTGRLARSDADHDVPVVVSARGAGASLELARRRAILIAAEDLRQAVVLGAQP